MRPPSSLARPPVSRYTDRRRGRADSGIRHGPVSRAGPAAAAVAVVTAVPSGVLAPGRRRTTRGWQRAQQTLTVPAAAAPRGLGRPGSSSSSGSGGGGGSSHTWPEAAAAARPYPGFSLGGSSSGLSTQAIHRPRAYLPTCKYKASQRRSSSDQGIDAARSLQRSGAGGLQISIDIYRRRPGCGKAAARRCCCRSTG